MSTGHATSQPGPGWALVKPPRLEQLAASAGRAVPNLQGAVARASPRGRGGSARPWPSGSGRRGLLAWWWPTWTGRGPSGWAGLGCPLPLGAGLDVTDQVAVARLVGRVEEELG